MAEIRMHEDCKKLFESFEKRIKELEAKAGI